LITGTRRFHQRDYLFQIFKLRASSVLRPRIDERNQSVDYERPARFERPLTHFNNYQVPARATLLTIKSAERCPRSRASACASALFRQGNKIRALPGLSAVPRNPRQSELSRAPFPPYSRPAPKSLNDHRLFKVKRH
jgi:hypothetical protein